MGLVCDHPRCSERGRGSGDPGEGLESHAGQKDFNNYYSSSELRCCCCCLLLLFFHAPRPRREGKENLVTYCVLGSGKWRQGRHRPYPQEVRGPLGEAREGRGLQEPRGEDAHSPGIRGGFLEECWMLVLSFGG